MNFYCVLTVLFQNFKTQKELNLDRFFFAIGSILAGLSIAAGAYGAHGGPSLDIEQTRWIAKAARYQMYHGIALICVSLAMSHWHQKVSIFKICGWLFLTGTLLFCGSLYAMTFWGINLGYVTPAGGLAFMAGWGLMAIAGLQKSS